MRMIRHCRQKIDLILTISSPASPATRWSCLYPGHCKQLGIAVIFEKENMILLEEDSELRITLSGARPI